MLFFFVHIRLSLHLTIRSKQAEYTFDKIMDNYQILMRTQKFKYDCGKIKVFNYSYLFLEKMVKKSIFLLNLSL